MAFSKRLEALEATVEALASSMHTFAGHVGEEGGRDRDRLEALERELKGEREETAAVLELHRMRMKDLQEDIAELDDALGEVFKSALRSGEEYTDKVVRKTAHSIDRVIESESGSRTREDARIRASVEDLQNAYDILTDRVAALEQKRENVVEVEIPHAEFERGVLDRLREEVQTVPLKREVLEPLAPGEYRVPYMSEDGIVHGEWKGFVRAGEPFLVRDTRGEPMMRHKDGEWVFVADYSDYVPWKRHRKVTEEQREHGWVTAKTALAVLRTHARGLGEEEKKTVETHLAFVEALLGGI